MYLDDWTRIAASVTLTSAIWACRLTDAHNSFERRANRFGWAGETSQPDIACLSCWPNFAMGRLRLGQGYALCVYRMSGDG